MELKEFVNKIFTRFPPDIKNGDSLESQLNDYLLAVDNGKNCDYEKAFIDLMRSYSFKTTPPAKIVIEILNQNTIKEAVISKPREFKSMFADKNGYTYEFGIEPEIGEWETKRRLIKMGFINIRKKDTTGILA